uniref:Protein trichome birefringence-like 23 n=1 Tax=Nelumbo nucifera TaxID=4432 RepID=A0A822YQ68_NELNU|nr:TPA_asm: hypothetical protein HUJ06_006965 [Nelumbo nucifera]
MITDIPTSWTGVEPKEKAVSIQSPAPAETPVSVDAPEVDDQTPQKGLIPEKCDLFTGDWIPNPSGPVYTNESCSFIEEHQNCMRNGRPDSEYLYWRWSPRDCELQRFNAEKFLELMRNKAWALIGDSISRNHVQSLLCVLSKVEKAVQVYHDEEYRSRIWYFPSYNFTLSVIWSPFLVKAAIFEDINGISTSEVQLYLDKLEKNWTDQYQSLDYMIISGGQWFLKSAVYHENDTIVGCHYCSDKSLTELGFGHAYRKALHLVLNYIATSNHKGLILFRTSTPDHFENGEWHNGGTCDRKRPFKEGEIEAKLAERVLREIELDEFAKAESIASENGVKLKLFDTTQLSLLRPDGHPGPYRHFQPFAVDKNAKVQYDCLHWCLPGPIDSWNDLLMELVVNG